jgi:hypothetical protein
LSSSERKDIHGAFTCADVRKPVANRFGSNMRRTTSRVGKSVTVGEHRRERGRVSATGAVGRPHLVPRDSDLQVVATVEEVIDGLGSVPTRDDHRRGPKRVQSLCEVTRRPGAAG